MGVDGQGLSVASLSAIGLMVCWYGQFTLGFIFSLHIIPIIIRTRARIHTLTVVILCCARASIPLSPALMGAGIGADLDLDLDLVDSATPLSAA